MVLPAQAAEIDDLERYVTAITPILELSTNAAENAIRPVALVATMNSWELGKVGTEKKIRIFTARS
jgi:hypothetical protein